MRFFWGVAVLVCFHAFGVCGVSAQENPDPNEITRRHRERFEPRVDSAIAAANIRYFSWKVSLELDPSDREMAARDLAEIIFSEDLRDFRAAPKVKNFLEVMVEDLDQFMGRTPDNAHVEMLNQLESAILKKFEEVRETSFYKDSSHLRLNQAIAAGPVIVGTSTFAVLFVYFAWNKVVRKLPEHAGGFKNWLKKNRTRLATYRQLRKAVKRDDQETVRACRQTLKDLRPERAKFPSKERLQKFGKRFGLWMGAGLVVASGLSTASYFYYYRPRRAWRAQELFLNDQFSDFVLDRKRMRSQTPNPR